jgi:hypothetical protein
MTAEQLTFPTSREVCALVAGDPMHERERAAVVEAIRDYARENDGFIDANGVRPRIPAWVGARVRGAVYNSLIAQGVLAPTGNWTTSDDKRGRNAGKPQRIYRWTEEL